MPQYDDSVEITLETVIRKEDEILTAIGSANTLVQAIATSL